jgi:glucosamine 6-phosphate synthetase-like amidotransferase/phosphosugar isomerase protein
VCGIAGYSVGEGSGIDRTLAAQALLAGIAERGADAVGLAWRSGSGGGVLVRKQRTGASALIDSLALPADAAQVLLHVRDYTKGHPTIEANNHPIRHGAVIGIHNGVIQNDDALFAAYGIERAAPEMTVDSEAIFALVDERPGDLSVLEELRGAMATAWLDEREPDALFLARGVGRPLWLGRGRHEVFFASTRATLDLVERALRLHLRVEEVGEARFLRVVGHRVAERRRFRADTSYREEDVLPAVRAPHEGAWCLERLAALAALA